MKCDIWKRLLLCGAVVITTAHICGCSNSAQKQKDTSGSGIKDMQNDEISELAFSVENYKKKMLSDRTSIAEYKEQYADDIDKLQKAEYKNLHFDGCVFAELPKPENDELEAFAFMDHGITVQESWDLVQKWLKDIGMQDEFDIKKDVRVVSEELGRDENDDYFPFYEHMSELDSGRGVHLNSKKCHIQIVDGIYSMSDGKIGRYLGHGQGAHMDAFGAHAEDVVESGTLSEIGDKTYELIGGKLSVAQGAQIVKDYFEAGTPFPIAENVELEVKNVNVFRLKDVYGYDYTLGRRYKSVPITNAPGGGYYDNQTFSLSGDSKNAYVVDDTGVSAFCGHNEAERMVTLVSDSEMMGLADATEHLSQKLAPYLDVQMEHVELLYVPLTFEPYAEEIIAFPCWQFEGTNKMDGYRVWIGVDAFTGEVYYIRRPIFLVSSNPA